MDRKKVPQEDDEVVFLILENSLAKQSQRRRHNLEHVYFFLSPSFFPAVSPAPALNWKRVFQNRKYFQWQEIYLEENDVSILNNIVLALLAISSSCFYCCFRTVLLCTRNQASEPATISCLWGKSSSKRILASNLEGGELHDLSHDKALLKICVNSSSCLGLN